MNVEKKKKKEKKESKYHNRFKLCNAFSHFWPGVYQVLVGSYLSVAGAFLGLIRPGRMSLFGMLLIVWGLVREIFSRKSTSTDLIYMYPAISFPLFAAFLSITRDVRRIIRCCRAPRFVKTKLI